MSLGKHQNGGQLAPYACGKLDLKQKHTHKTMKSFKSINTNKFQESKRVGKEVNQQVVSAKVARKFQKNMEMTPPPQKKKTV